MKCFLTLAVGFLLAAQAIVQADEVAIIELQINREKQLRRVVLDFHEADAPQTVANFKELTRDGFYKGIKVHRVFPNTLVQMGDPLSRQKDRSKVGTGGPGYTLPPEIRRRHTAGAVAMSRLPDTINPARRSNGSQFYICLKSMPNLDGEYTVFAQVIEGMDVLEQISNRPADSNDNPVDPIVIRSVRIVPRAE